MINSVEPNSALASPDRIVGSDDAFALFMSQVRQRQ